MSYLFESGLILPVFVSHLVYQQCADIPELPRAGTVPLTEAQWAPAIPRRGPFPDLTAEEERRSTESLLAARGPAPRSVILPHSRFSAFLEFSFMTASPSMSLTRVAAASSSCCSTASAATQGRPTRSKPNGQPPESSQLAHIGRRKIVLVPRRDSMRRRTGVRSAASESRTRKGPR